MNLEEILATMEGDPFRADFRELAQEFERRLRDERLPHEQRNMLWARYQLLWSRRKSQAARARTDSESQKNAYMNEITGIEYGHDGGPILQSFGHFARVGEKARHARERLKHLRSQVKNDSRLLPRDRFVLNQALNDYWDRVCRSEEVAFAVHEEQAERIYNDCAMAVDVVSPREASALLRAAQAEIHALSLRHDDRARYRVMFDSLWDRLKARIEERNADWRQRQEQGLDRLVAARDKARDALQRVRSNLEQNHERRNSAGSSEYADRVAEWISEGEAKVRDIEDSLSALEEKIRDAQTRLQR